MLKLDLKKEIGELGALVIAFIIGFVAGSFWIGLISFVVLELVYLLVYDAIAKKAEAQKPKEEKDKRKEDELVAVAKEVFSRRRFVTYVELAEEIQSILEVKERTAKSYIRFMREKEIILKSSDNQSYYVIGNF